VPFVFSIAGVLLIVAGVRGKTSDLFSLVKSDFTGQPNYFEWMVAIFLVGAIGYIKQLSTISRMFMFIVAAGLLYKNKGVFSQFTQQETAQPASVQGVTVSGTLGTLPQLPSLDSFLNTPIGGTSIAQEGE
jgi:hypothetical protein